MSMFDVDRYNSNDWIDPIVAEARPVFGEFPPDVATEVAAAVLLTVDTGCADIPWATVFPSDDKSKIAFRLLGVLREPDYDTPPYKPDTHLAVEELKLLLLRHDAVGMLGAQAAYHFVQAAAGKESETFLTYQDKARRWPQYASAWTEKLIDQFGNNGYKEITATSPELGELLGKIETAADLHYEARGNMQQPGESANDLITRTLDFFDVTTVEGLAEAARILGRGFEGYRRLSYQIRGLSEPSDS